MGSKDIFAFAPKEIIDPLEKSVGKLTSTTRR